jgi:hypothetical protein
VQASGCEERANGSIGLPSVRGTFGCVVERVVPVEFGVEWEPNAPDTLLMVRDNGLGPLVLRAHFDDVDQRLVSLLWGGCVAAVIEPPNDEALSGHYLYDKGLSDVLWAGEVLDGTWIADLERRNRVPLVTIQLGLPTSGTSYFRSKKKRFR